MKKAAILIENGQDLKDEKVTVDQQRLLTELTLLKKRIFDLGQEKDSLMKRIGALDVEAKKIFKLIDEVENALPEDIQKHDEQLTESKVTDIMRHNDNNRTS